MSDNNWFLVSVKYIQKRRNDDGSPRWETDQRAITNTIRYLELVLFTKRKWDLAGPAGVSVS